jgi:cytochrome c-type biogenesis protein CcmH/NrfG
MNATTPRNHAEAKVVLTTLASGQNPDARAACYLGRIAMRADDAKQATEWFEAATRLEPDNPDYHLWLGRADGARARESSKLSQIGLAKKIRAQFERASTLDPENLEARSSLIDYYLQAPGMLGGSVDKARQQAAEIRKRDAYRGALADARIAEDQKDLAGAERSYQEAVRTRPDSLNARYALGSFYSRRIATTRPSRCSRRSWPRNPTN